MRDTASGSPKRCTTSADAPDVHEHGWAVESRHSTSAGRVLYVRCEICGARRVDFQERADVPPVALSGELRPRSAVEGFVTRT